MILADPQNREEWLKERTQGIGGSDAGCIVGANPWKSARQLWREKTGPALIVGVCEDDFCDLDPDTAKRIITKKKST